MQVTIQTHQEEFQAVMKARLETERQKLEETFSLYQLKIRHLQQELAHYTGQHEDSVQQSKTYVSEFEQREVSKRLIEKSVMDQQSSCLKTFFKTNRYMRSLKIVQPFNFKNFKERMK